MRTNDELAEQAWSRKCAAWIVAMLLVIGGAQHAVAEQAFDHQTMVDLWQARTTGENLAAGRPVTFYPSPDYHLTRKEGTDPLDLTDGKLVGGSRQALWFSSQAVGWGKLSGEVKRITLDLGEVRAVDRIVWRVVAGSVQRAFRGPSRVRLYGSEDGLAVHPIGEHFRYREDYARPDSYELPNLGPEETGTDVYVYPLEIPAQGYPMRYVILEFEMDTHWMASDELAVMAASDTSRTVEDLRALPRVALQTRDVWIASPRDELPVVPGIRLPVWFQQSDLRVEGSKRAVRYRFRLPEGVRLEAASRYPVKWNEATRELVISAREGGNTNGLGPFFFIAEQGLTEPAVVEYFAEGVEADAQPARQLVLRQTDLPEPFKLDRLTVSIGWMDDYRRREWPDFAQSYARLGFNTVPSMPRRWLNPKDGLGTSASQLGLSSEAIAASGDPAALTEWGQELDAFREQGMKIVYMESPFHVVNWSFPEQASEYRDQLPTGMPTNDSFCSTYRGPFYQQEVQRIRDSYLLMGGADYVIWDCEFIGSSKNTAPRCSRCAPAQAASGMEWLAFLRHQWGGVFAELNTLVREDSAQRGWPTPEIGMYSVHAVRPYADLMLYPNEQASFDFQNPSLYVGDHDEVVHDLVRQTRQASGTNNIIPWMTTRTGGDVPPTLVKVMAWEAFLNGARGMTYYHLGDFDPGQLVALSEALAAVAPHEDLIVEGSPAHDDITVTQGEARVSAVEHEGRVLLLLVNPTEQPQIVQWTHTGGHHGQVELTPRSGQLVAFAAAAP